MLRQSLPKLLGLARAPASAAPRCVRPLSSTAARFYSAKPEGEEGASEGASAEGEAAPQEKNEWQTKFENKDKECAKFKDAYQRSVAEFRNLQNTTQKEVEKQKAFALQKFAKDLIESVDNFDLAVRALPKETLEVSGKDVQEFYNGITMVQGVLEKTLAKHGIVKVNPIDEKFDPNEHEALFQIPQEGKEPGTIIHVDRTGFKLHDRVLRAPKVGFVQDPSDN